MIDKKVYCENCKEVVIYSTKEERKTKQINSERIYYKGLRSYCTKCGNEVFVSELEKENLKRLNDEIRIKNDILSLEDQIDFIKNSNYTYDELSELLNVAPNYIELMLNGLIPPKHVSDKIKELMNKKTLHK